MNAWLPLLVTLAIQAAGSMALLTLPAMAPEVACALDVSASQAGLYIALAYAAALFASLVSGSAVLRWGAIRVSQGCLLLCAAGMVVSTLAWLPGVALGAVLIGLGYGPITPASSHLLARTTRPEQMSLVFSVKQTGVPLGGMLAGAVVPVAAVATSWRGALLVSAGICLACALWAQPLRARLDDDRRPAQPLALGQLSRPLRLVWAHPALVTLAFCSFAFSITQVSLTTYLVTHLHTTFAYTLVAAGFVLSVCQLGGVVGRIAWGYVADRWLGARGTLLLLAALMAVCALVTALLSTAPPAWVLLLLLAVFGGSAIGWNGVYLAEVARQAPAGKAGLATGGTLAFTYLGVVFGPPLFGLLADGVGSYRAGFAFLVLPATVAGLALARQLWRPAKPAGTSG